VVFSNISAVHMVLCKIVCTIVGGLAQAARVAVHDHVGVTNNASHAGECVDMFS